MRNVNVQIASSFLKLVVIGIINTPRQAKVMGKFLVKELPKAFERYMLVSRAEAMKIIFSNPVHTQVFLEFVDGVIEKVAGEYGSVTKEQMGSVMRGTFLEQMQDYDVDVPDAVWKWAGQEAPKAHSTH